MTNTVLDVSTIQPHARHATVFAAFDGLAVGGAVTLANDHDPRPLFHLFNAQRAGEFAWDYLEQGPERWQVRIARVAEAPRERGASCCGNCG